MQKHDHHQKKFKDATVPVTSFINKPVNNKDIRAILMHTNKASIKLVIYLSLYIISEG